MDLYKIIPSNNKWIISKNIVYIDYLYKIPILMKRGSDIFVFMDLKIYKYVIEISKILIDNKIPFTFRSTHVFFDHKFSQEEIHHLNIRQQLNNICDDKFFDGFNKLKIDFTDILIEYIKKYECYEELNFEYKKMLNKVINEKFDYWTNSHYSDYKEDIRNYIISLERDIKIKMLF